MPKDPKNINTLTPAALAMLLAQEALATKSGNKNQNTSNDKNNASQAKELAANKPTPPPLPPRPRENRNLASGSPFLLTKPPRSNGTSPSQLRTPYVDKRVQSTKEDEDFTGDINSIRQILAEPMPKKPFARTKGKRTRQLADRPKSIQEMSVNDEQIKITKFVKAFQRVEKLFGAALMRNPKNFAEVQKTTQELVENVDKAQSLFGLLSDKTKKDLVEQKAWLDEVHNKIGNNWLSVLEAGSVALEAGIKRTGYGAGEVVVGTLTGVKAIFSTALKGGVTILEPTKDNRIEFYKSLQKASKAGGMVMGGAVDIGGGAVFGIAGTFMAGGSIFCGATKGVLQVGCLAFAGAGLFGLYAVAIPVADTFAGAISGIGYLAAKGWNYIENMPRSSNLKEDLNKRYFKPKQ